MRVLGPLVIALATLGMGAERLPAQVERSAAPLYAWFEAPLSSEIRFGLARAAYVAVFEVRPGEGIYTVYPRGSSQAARTLSGGEHSLSPGGAVGRMDAGRADRRYLVLIAADRPLRLQRMTRSPAALIAELGFGPAHTAVETGAISRLAEYLLPLGTQTSWTYDVYEWNTYGGWAAQRGYSYACGGGIFIVGSGLLVDTCSPYVWLTRGRPGIPDQRVESAGRIVLPIGTVGDGPDERARRR